MKQFFPADGVGIGNATEYIRSLLKGKNRKETARTILLVEEAIGELVSHAAKDCQLCVVSRTFLGTTTFDLSVSGEAFDINDSLAPSVSDLWAMPDSETGDALRRFVLQG